MLGGLLFLTLLAQVELSGTVDCPARAAIEEELGRRRPAGGRAAALRVHLERGPDALRLSQLDEAGGVQLVRELPLAGSCGDQARAAAVVIASWLVRLEGAAPPLELPPTPGPSAPDPPEAALASAPPVAPRAPGWQLQLAAAALAQLDAAGASPGGAVEVALTPPRSPVAPVLTFVATAASRTALAPGEASWWRARFGTSLVHRRRLGPLVLGLQADAWHALVLVRGAGFQTPRTASGYDLGLGAGVTLGLPAWTGADGRRQLVPFIGVSGAGWLLPQELVAQQPGGASTAPIGLPRLEALVRLGAAFRAL